MKNLKDESSLKELAQTIQTFISTAGGLEMRVEDTGKIQIMQKADEKRIKFHLQDLSEVLTREDKEGKVFIQVNFIGGKKILLTESLVGFKPEPRANLDLNRLPRVVTTPDLLSVFEAIEEVVNAEVTNPEEVEMLKEVYQSILHGGEAVGFDLQSEKIWLSRLLTSGRASA